MNYFIYAIKNETSDDVYIGSTERTLAKRFQSHTGHYRLWLKQRAGYCSSYEIVQCPTAYIEYIEGVDEEDRYDKEQYWINNTPNVVNKKNSSTEAVEERRRLGVKKYYEANKDKIRAQQKAYYEKNK